MENALAAQFAALDRDSNGYLEQSELPEGNMILARALRAADADNDGKLYRAELEAFAAWQRALLSASVRLSVSSAADPLFGLLDASGDGRLTQRELRAARDAAKARDRNGDGRLELAELPVAIRLDFGRASYAREGAPDSSPGDSPDKDSAAATRADSGPPTWFVRMDLNGDGDLVPSEFLGNREQFAALDTNGDGFIDAIESRAAK
jgi:Ca2+-binding EF-hand superfamily protein